MRICVNEMHIDDEKLVSIESLSKEERKNISCEVSTDKHLQRVVGDYRADGHDQEQEIGE